MRIIRIDGKSPASIDEIGGPLGLNDGFEMRVKTDDMGVPSYELYMYRVKDRDAPEPEYEQRKFDIDMAELDRLAKIGDDMNNARRS